MLRQGSYGDEVLRLQRALNQYGYGLQEDSQYGPLTAAAVKEFQRSKGLSSDGVVGPQTTSVLYPTTPVQTASSYGDPSWIGDFSGMKRTQAQLPQFTWKPTTLDYGEATKRATSELAPMYDVQSTQRIRQRANDLLARGGYGQPDSASIVAQDLAPLEAARNMAIAGRAGELVNLESAADQAARQQAWQEYAFAHNLRQSDLDRALQEASLTGTYQGQPTLESRNAELANALRQAEFDWQKQYQNASLGLERDKLSAAKTAAVPAVTSEQQYKNSLWQKLVDGHELTEEEKTWLGFKGTTDNVLYQAVRLAQSDPDWGVYDAEDMVQKYVRILLGQEQPQSNPLDDNEWFRNEGWLKE